MASDKYMGENDIKVNEPERLSGNKCKMESDSVLVNTFGNFKLNNNFKTSNYLLL